MIYAFGPIDTGKSATKAIIDFIKNENQGIFVLPEAILNISKIDTEQLKDITSDEKKVIVAGSGRDEYEKACIFAYGEEEPVLEINQIFTVPYKDSKIRIAVRVCRDILQPYCYTDFHLICHPSAASLDMLEYLNNLNSFRDIKSILNLGDIMVASSCFNAEGQIIDFSGEKVGSINVLPSGIKCTSYDAEFKGR